MSHTLAAAKEHINNVDDPFWACWDCKGWSHAYMVHDEIWLKAWPDYPTMRLFLKSVLCTKSHGREAGGEMRLVLCFECLEKRLGRKLRIVDLTDYPINNLLKKGAAMALEGLE